MNINPIKKHGWYKSSMYRKSYLKNKLIFTDKLQSIILHFDKDPANNVLLKLY